MSRLLPDSPLDASSAAGRKPWGGRFQQPTDAEVERFTASLDYDWVLYPYDIQGSIAHAQMLAHCGIIRPEEGEMIVAGLERIREEIETGHLQPKVELEDVHMNIEARLVELIGDVGRKLHTARSRNDQVALDLRLYVRAEVDGLVARINRLLRALVDCAEEHQDVLMPGYTHLQRGQPVYFAHHLLAYGEMFLRDRERLEDARRRVNVLPLGAGALAGSSLPIDPEFVAQRLGFERVVQNSLDAVSDRDFVEEVVFCCCLVMQHLSRLAEEIVLWSSAEFGFVMLPDALCTGSSLMPQKKNPDVAELIRGKTGRVYGALVSLLTLLKGLPLSYNRDLQEDKPALMEALVSTGDCLHMAVRLVEGMQPVKERMEAAARDEMLLATDLVEYLVRKGVPFRRAHEACGRLVAYAQAAGRRFSELGLEEFRRFAAEFAEDVFEVLDARHSADAKAFGPGTAAHKVAERIQELKGRIG